LPHGEWAAGADECQSDSKGAQAIQITTITIADNYYFYMQWSAGKYIGGEELTMSTIASSGAVIHVRATSCPRQDSNKPFP
jgi:hypothetical protein